MAKFRYEHPDLIREGLSWTGPSVEPEPVTVPEPKAVEETVLPNPYGKLCEICGKPLQSKRQKKYCSPECRELANDRWAAQQRHEKSMTIVRTCQFCGKEYHPAESKRRKYCSYECSRLAVNRFMRIRRAIERGEDPDAPEKERVCVVCGVKLPATAHHSTKTCSPECRRENMNQLARERCRRKKEAQNGKAPDDRTV